MEYAAPGSSEIADLSSQDAQTVCEALGRYEETLRGAVREIHVDIQVFKRGVEQQLEDVLRLAGPLPRSVCELQQENRALRAQVQRLAQRVEQLARSAGLQDGWAAEEGALPGPPCAPGGALPGSPITPGGSATGLPSPGGALPSSPYSPGGTPGSPLTPRGAVPGSPCTPGGPLPSSPYTPGGALPSSPYSPGGTPGSPLTPRGAVPGSPCTPGRALPGFPLTPGGTAAGFPSQGGSSPGSPSTPGTRFASRAMLSMTGRTQSMEQDVQNETESRRISNSSAMANGHQPVTGQLRMPHEVASPAQTASLSSQEYSPTVSLRMPHQPVTAVTRVSEKFSGESATSLSANTSSGHLVQSQQETAMKTANQSASTVKSWSAGSVRTMGVSMNSEKSSSVTSVTKSMSTKSYGLSSGTTSSDSALDSYFDVTPKSRSPPPVIHRQVEKRRELVRSQTLPRASGTQARKAFFEKFDPDVGKAKGESKVKLKRSQSFGVASASSIKQVLLDWCKSKTIGYKKIELQNFSSSWSDGMAFCALVHSFFPEAFDYDAMSPTNPKQNFETAFSTAEKMANCDRLIEVDDMLMMGRKPDPMCVFTYVQSLYNHLRRFE